MKGFIAVLMLLLGVLDLVQPECKKYSINPEIVKMCKEGKINPPRKFVHPDVGSSYLECENKAIKQVQCALYYDPFENQCANEIIVFQNRICPEDLEKQLRVAYLDWEWLDFNKNKKPPVSEYFVECKPDSTKVVKVCYGDGLKCVFNNQTKECEESI